MTRVAVALLLALTGCSVDIVPVSSNRVKSARKVSKLDQVGPGSPGYFSHSWSFAAQSSPTARNLGGGYLMDPTQVEIAGGTLRLRRKPAGTPFDTQTQVIQATTGIPYVALEKFAETTGAGHKGVVHYQLSNDGQRWYWFDGSKWSQATPHLEKANPAAVVTERIRSFPLDVGAGSLYFKAFLSSPSGSEPVEIAKLEVSGISPETDSWD
ncbi:MAG TPA: hypothetical protein VM598_03050 [Bdellovibrionota bacterium]|nr:hypothetical protein [Bdellovibrionota bacterium]